MGRKRPERTERRKDERAARALVRDREKLALLLPGGAAEHPIAVTSSAVIDIRVSALPCVQCNGEYRLVEHEAPGAGLRKVSVTCRVCGVPRVLWFKIVVDEPN